jgi:uncharacterized membrane protein YhaH (DUF805 family)
MKRLLSLWFGLSAPVSRRVYTASGFGLMLFKYGVEAAAIHAVTGNWLSPLTYLNPLLSARQQVLAGHDGLFWALALWTLPFLWIGVSMTLRRAEDAGLSRFVALLYFLPVVSYLLMLTLCALPSRPRAEARPGSTTRVTRDPLRSALLGMGVGMLIALGTVAASVLAFGLYGTTLFVGAPFLMGAASAFVFNHGVPRTMGSTFLVAGGAVLLAGGALLLFALEGLLCLIMAAPLALALAMMGAVLGRAAAAAPNLRPRGVAAMMVLPLPVFAGIDLVRPPSPVREVVTVAEIAAPPAAVWPSVVAVSDLVEPPALVFRLGIAYPQRATIEGRGVGALRRCEFSTGAFLEPITAWEEPKRLAFDVAAQPPPLHELSPYRRVFARHLDGYLRVRSGEFLLRPLSGGRARLEGRTRYELRVFPASYWGLWSDALIHAIHTRVLEHIKLQTERGQKRT